MLIGYCIAVNTQILLLYQPHTLQTDKTPLKLYVYLSVCYISTTFLTYQSTRITKHYKTHFMVPRHITILSGNCMYSMRTDQSYGCLHKINVNKFYVGTECTGFITCSK